MKNIKYSLDTSALLDGHTRYYPIDVFPTLWDNFDTLISNGKIKATELVHNELKKKDDETFKWIKDRDVFISVDEPIQGIVWDILQKYPKLVAEGGERSNADAFMIAFAKQHECIVVTGERGGSEKSPKIPFICNEIGIECIDFLKLIRCEKWSF